MLSEFGVAPDQPLAENPEPQVTQDNTSGTVAPEMIEIRKSKLDAIMQRVERLEAAANKAGLARYDTAHKEDMQKVIRLRVFDGKVVKSWSDMLIDKVEKHPKSGVWGEQQIIELSYFDAEPQEMDYVTFARHYKYLPCVVESQIMNIKPELVKSMGNYTFNLKTFDGREYQIGSLFVN